MSVEAVLAGWAALLRGDARAIAGVHSLLSAQYGSREVLLTDSGTTALALAIRAAVACRPDCPRVALPAWACYDLATAARAAEVGVVFYDLDPTTLGPERGSLDQALAVGVAAVVVVHAYGLPMSLADLATRAALAGAVLIEDAAQATGARVGSLRAGAAGALGILSFGRGKGWTGGGGGALLVNPSAPAGLAIPLPASLMPSRRSPGAAMKLTAQWLFARPGLYAVPSGFPFLQLGQTVYRPPTVPSQMAVQAAAVLLATASLQDRESDRRRANADRLRRAAEAGGAGSIPAPEGEGQPGWLRLPLLLTDAALQRAAARQARSLGILPAYPRPLTRLPGFSASVPGGPTTFPGAEELVKRLHTLPTHGQLSADDLAGLEQWLSRDRADHA